MTATLVVGTLLAISSLAAAPENGRSPLHGSLEPGPHGVGFTTVRMEDATRPQSPSKRARGLTVHVWYPAASGGDRAMTFADAMVAHLEGRADAERAQRDTDARRFLSQFGPVSDGDWARLRGTPFLSRRDAPAASGRFPLVIGQLRPLSTQVTNEYLASHGYVVAMTHGDPVPDPPDAGGGLDIAYRDMEFAIPHLRRLPYVDAERLAALGFSGAGFSQVLLAMRHPDVMAVCDLESAIFDDRLMWPLSRGYGYDVTALRVPFLHTYSVPLSERESRITDFERMRYSTRYRYLVDVPGIHHWDFATEGFAASTILQNRGEHGQRLRQAFETTNRYVLAFFNAYVKGDAEGLAFLRRSPEANGAPAGLATIRELPAVEPAPTVDGFGTLIAQKGVAEAMRVFERARAADPEAALFREPDLNRLGYRLLRGGNREAAVAVFRKVTAIHPASANAHDSLAEALEAAGDVPGALAATRRALELLSASEPTAGGKELHGVLQTRLKRLGG
jgi:hypothetical protein